MRKRKIGGPRSPKKDVKGGDARMREKERGDPHSPERQGRVWARSPLIERETGSTEIDGRGGHARQRKKDREPHSP